MSNLSFKSFGTLTLPLIIIILLLSCKKVVVGPFTPFALQCEYMDEPLGVDVDVPRFRWMHNAEQTTYRVVVDTDSTAVSGGTGSSWDSGKVEGSGNLAIYAGDSLKPFTRYYWAVQVWSDGELFMSDVASFETGVKDDSNWKGGWITDTNDINLKPAGYFRKGYQLSRPIRSARRPRAAAPGTT